MPNSTPDPPQPRSFLQRTVKNKWAWLGAAGFLASVLGVWVIFFAPVPAELGTLPWQLEAAFLDALNSANRHEIKTGTLSIYYSGSSKVLVFGQARVP